MGSQTEYVIQYYDLSYYTKFKEIIIYLYMFTDCFMKISLQSEQICSENWREIFITQSVNKTDKLTSVTFVHKAVH